MQRRDFIRLMAGAAAAWPLAMRAQERTRRIAVLMQATEDNADAQHWVAALREGLRKAGFVEGQNLRSDYRWGGTDLSLLQRFAKEIVAAKPDLIFTSSSPTTQMFKQETRTIPIVFGNVVDPIGQGFVASLSKPGGNITGFVNLEASVTGKYVQLLKEIAPDVARVTLFYNPATMPYHDIYVGPFETAAAALGIATSVAPVDDVSDLEKVMATQAREPNGGLVSMPGGFEVNNFKEIVALAARYRLPTVYSNIICARGGGLLAYSNDTTDNYYRAAAYVARILKGEKPADLPVQFPVKFELVINAKTAKALGLSVSRDMQSIADEVIE